MRCVVVLALLAGCSPAALPMSADHPANPAAPTGRLAGPPAALRPGVATPPATDASTPAPPSTPSAPTGHEGHH